MRMGVLTLASRSARTTSYPDIDAFFAEIREIDVEALGFQHQFNALSGGAVILDQ